VGGMVPVTAECKHLEHHNSVCIGCYCIGFVVFFSGILKSIDESFY
jgi:hypothetical protein